MVGNGSGHAMNDLQRLRAVAVASGDVVEGHRGHGQLCKQRLSQGCEVREVHKVFAIKAKEQPKKRYFHYF